MWTPLVREQGVVFITNYGNTTNNWNVWQTTWHNVTLDYLL